MGAGISKEEQLYQAVQNGNHNLVKSLRRDGASLEFIDKEGRTPLILACARQDLFDMVITLLNLGANPNAYRPGSNGGFPLHHAAKRGLEKTVILLISRGADPLCINDDGQTPLDMARLRGHTSIVRIIEDRICLFSGMLREVSGPGLLEVLVPQWVTKRVWAVVLPTPPSQRQPPRHELVIYQSSKLPAPRTTISLWKVDLEEPRWNHPSPVLIITERATKARYKFLPDADGDKAQLERVYRACRGIPRDVPTMGFPVPSVPNQMAQMQSQEDAALAMAIDASLQTATSEEANGWDQAPAEGYNGWGPPEPKSNRPTDIDNSDYGGWAPESSSNSTYNGWGSQEVAGTSQTEEALEAPPQQTPAVEERPSAPPLPEDGDFPPGPIHYPSIDTSPVSVPYPATSTGAPAGSAAGKEKETGGQCVVCWDAPAQGVCIPCGHMAGCMECLQEIKNKKWGCPVCRSPIEQVVKVFAV